MKPPSSDNLQNNLSRRIECFEAASHDYVPAHRSKHWDVFGDRFFTALKNPNSWKGFMHNEISSFFELTNVRHENLVVSEPAERNKWARTYNSLCDLIGPDFVKRFSEAEIGSPIHLPIDGIKIHPIDLHLVYYASVITGLCKELADAPRIIIEIGGGYGGLGAKLKRIYPGSLIIMLDLPETLMLQGQYLETSFPEARIFDYVNYKEGRIPDLDPENFDFALLPGWLITEIPDAFTDIVINTRSMMEMNREVVKFYMEQIQRTITTSGIFYCVNRYEKAKVDLPIRIKEFDFDEYWYLCVDRPVWDQGPSVHEIAAVRVRLANTHPPSIQMKNLPPISFADIKGKSLELFELVFFRLKLFFVILRLRAWIVFYLTPRNVFVKLFPTMYETLRRLIRSS